MKPTELHDSFDEVRNGHRHEAVDIMEPRGTPVLAVADGKVEKLFHSVAGGNTIYEFDRSGTYCYYYAHLDHYADNIHEGMLISQGTVLGYVGTSGNAPVTSPHLHFAIAQLDSKQQWWKGVPIDPYPSLMAGIRESEAVTAQ